MRGVCQQNDAGMQIYKAKCTYHDIQSNNGIPDACITAKTVNNMVTGFDKDST